MISDAQRGVTHRLRTTNLTPGLSLKFSVEILSLPTQTPNVVLVRGTGQSIGRLVVDQYLYLVY